LIYLEEVILVEGEPDGEEVIDEDKESIPGKSPPKWANELCDLFHSHPSSCPCLCP